MMYLWNILYAVAFLQKNKNRTLKSENDNENDEKSFALAL